MKKVGERDTAPKFLHLELLSQPLLRHIFCYTNCIAVTVIASLPENYLIRSIPMKVVFALFAVVWASTVATANATTTAEGKVVTPLSYERAVPVLRKYCIERLCLGMTIQEVQALGRIEWNGARVPNGAVSCVAGGPENKAVGDFLTSDGTAFQVGFEPVTRTGAPVSRYRLAFAELKVPNVTRLQLDGLMASLLKRFDPIHDLNNGLFGTGTEDELFNIYFKKTYAGQLSPNAPAQIFMMAEYRFKAPWLFTLPECQAGLPKL